MGKCVQELPKTWNPLFDVVDPLRRMPDFKTNSRPNNHDFFSRLDPEKFAEPLRQKEPPLARQLDRTMTC